VVKEGRKEGGKEGGEGGEGDDAGRKECGDGRKEGRQW
jgi:hypothetical protein